MRMSNALGRYYRSTTSAAAIALGWRRCKAAGEALGLISQYSGHADGTEMIAADTIGPLIRFAGDTEWRQVLTASNTPAGMKARSRVNESAGKRDQGGSSSVAIAPSDSTRRYFVQEAIVCVLNGTAIAMSPQTSFMAFANSTGAKRHGPNMRVHPTDKNLVLWVHGEGATLSPDGFTTDAGKIATIPATTDPANGYGCVGFDPTNLDVAYVHSWGNGLYRSTNVRVSSPTWTKVNGAPIYVAHMRIGPTGKVYLCETSSDGSGDLAPGHLWYLAGSTLTQMSNCPMQAHDVAIDPTNADRLIVFTSGTFSAMTTDHGGNWSSGQFYYNKVAIDVPALGNLGDSSGFYMSAAEFSPAPANTIVITHGIGTSVCNYSPTISAMTGAQTITSRSSGIWQLIPYGFFSHIGRPALFGNQDHPIASAKFGLDVSPAGFAGSAGGFAHGWHITGSRANPGYCVGTISSEQGGVECGWSNDNYDTWAAFDHQPFANVMAGGAMAVSASKDRIICAPGRNEPLRCTLDRGATAWPLLDLPGLPSGCSSGQTDYFFRRQIVAADAVDADEFLIYHRGIQPGGAAGNSANAGFFRVQASPSGFTPTRQSTGYAVGGAGSGGSAVLDAIPGRAGEYLFAGDSDYQDLPLLLIKNRGATRIASTRVTNCRSVSFGANGVTGVLARIDGGPYGIYYTHDYPDDAATWTGSSAIPLDDYVGMPDFIHLDRNTPGVFYAGMSGKAWITGLLF